MGLGPGGIPIDANHLNKGLGMGNLGPGGECGANASALFSIGDDYLLLSCFVILSYLISYVPISCGKRLVLMILYAYLNIVCIKSTGWVTLQIY